MFEIEKFNTNWRKKSSNKRPKDNAVGYLLSCITRNCDDITNIVSVIKNEKLFLDRSYYEELIKQPYLPEKYRKEFSFLFKINEKLNSERKEKDKIINFFSFDELILEMSFLFEYVRISENLPLGYHENLLETINYILNQKVYLLEKSEQKPQAKYQSEHNLQKYFIEIIGYLSYNSIQTWEIYHLYKFYQKYATFQGILDRYCYQQNFELSFFSNESANFKPIDIQEYELWHKNGLKYSYLANYYDIFGFPLYSDTFDKDVNEINKSDMDFGNKNAQLKVLCNTYQFLVNGFDEIIAYQDHNNKKFEFSASLALRLLNTLAGWTNIRWNSKIESLKNGNSKSVFEKIISLIMTTFIPPHINITPLFLRTNEQFIAQINDTLKNQFGEEEIKSTVNFLTNNLNIQKIQKINLFTKPFIKLGGFIYSFCGLLSNTNFAVMLENLILENDKNNTSYTKEFDDIAGINNEQSTSEIDEVKESNKERSLFKNKREKFVEATIPALFELHKNNFSILPSHEFMKEDVDKKILLQGNTDCYVYEKFGNKLFIFQVKSTYARHTYKQIHDHQEAIEKAKSQLAKDIVYLRDFGGFGEIKPLLNITQNNFQDLQIIPIIINTNFEYDEQSFSVESLEGFKISLLELEIILRNTKNFLFNPKDIIQKYYGFVPSEFAVFEGKKQENPQEMEKIWGRFFEILKILDDKGKINLRENYDCNANDLIDAIKNRKIWDMLPSNFTPKMTTITIDNFTLNFYQ